MAFPLFLLLNFVLFIRPEEIYPPIAGIRLYYCVFIACIVFSFGELQRNLNLNRLLGDPITCCIILYGLVFTVSNVISVGLLTAREQFVEYFKLFLYYLLFISLVTSVSRLRTFLWAVCFYTLIITGLVLLDHYEFVDIFAIKPMMQNEYGEDGAILGEFPRLIYLGFFQDPNDLSMILGMALTVSGYFLFTGQTILRVLWLLPMGAYAWLMMFTQSRGGLLGLAAAVGAYFLARVGWKKALPLAGVAIVGLLIAVGGRQANFNLASGTGQDRLKIWSDGLIQMSQPRTILLGIGFGQYEEEVGQVAHNSYVHAFVETGMIGGVLFSGMMLLAFGAVFLHTGPWFHYYEPELATLRPFLLAVFAGYLVCMFSLSRNYVVTTYMILGMATAYLRLSYRLYQPAWYQMGWRMMIIIAMLGLLVFIVMKVFLMSFVQFGAA